MFLNLFSFSIEHVLIWVYFCELTSSFSFKMCFQHFLTVYLRNWRILRRIPVNLTMIHQWIWWKRWSHSILARLPGLVSPAYPVSNGRNDRNTLDSAVVFPALCVRSVGGLVDCQVSLLTNVNHTPKAIINVYLYILTFECSLHTVHDNGVRERSIHSCSLRFNSQSAKR